MLGMRSYEICAKVDSGCNVSMLDINNHIVGIMMWDTIHGMPAIRFSYADRDDLDVETTLLFNEAIDYLEIMLIDGYSFYSKKRSDYERY